VFEIGSSLREARQRRGLELSEIERHTRIRSRYLRALEEERFDLLPGAAYAKGFLRTYADYLGLDADRFVAELAWRLPTEDEETPLQPRPYPLGRRRRVVAPLPLVALAVVIAAVVVIVALGGKSGPKRSTVPPPEPPPAGVAGRKATVGTEQPRPQDRLATLVLQAVRGRCWIEAHAGSRGGRRLYYAILEQGGSLQLRQRRLWLRIGVPAKLDATLNGKSVTLPRTSPVDLVVTPGGVRGA
jgi:transcriptional regulator with XRE-family HTH domain